MLKYEVVVAFDECIVVRFCILLIVYNEPFRTGVEGCSATSSLVLCMSSVSSIDFIIITVALISSDGDFRKLRKYRK
jgi:hypothetical protein